MIPGLTVLFFFILPWIGRNRVGRAFNIVLTLFLVGGLVVLSWQSYAQGDARMRSIKQHSRQVRSRPNG